MTGRWPGGSTAIVLAVFAFVALFGLLHCTGGDEMAPELCVMIAVPFALAVVARPLPNDWLLPESAPALAPIPVFRFYRPPRLPNS